MISSPFRLALSHRIAARIAVNKVSRSTKTACKEAGKHRRGNRAQPTRPARASRSHTPPACALDRSLADRFPAGKPLGNTLRQKETVTAGGRTLRYNNPRTRARDLGHTLEPT